MKQFYTLGVALLLCTSFKGFSQCSNVQSDVNYGYSHVKSAYEANNLTHLQYYAHRSLEAFSRAQKKFESCKCETAANFTYENIQLLEKVDRSETFEDARFFIKRAVEGAKNTVNALDVCTVNSGSESSSNFDVDIASNSNQAYTTSSTKLAANSDALKLAAQKEQELFQVKQLFIKQNKTVLMENIEAYNKALSMCNCNSSLVSPNLSTQESSLSNKSIDDIKSHYLNALKQTASAYLDKLNSCNSTN